MSNSACGHRARSAPDRLGNDVDCTRHIGGASCVILCRSRVTRTLRSCAAGVAALHFTCQGSGPRVAVPSLGELYVSLSCETSGSHRMKMYVHQQGHLTVLAAGLCLPAWALQGVPRHDPVAAHLRFGHVSTKPIKTQQCTLEMRCHLCCCRLRGALCAKQLAAHIALMHAARRGSQRAPAC